MDKVKSLETQVELYKECIEELEERIEDLKDEKNRIRKNIDWFRLWLEENQMEEDHYSKQRPKPQIVKLLRADTVLNKLNEAMRK